MSLKSHELLPEDATQEEIEFLEFGVCNLYKALERKEDMFLVAFIYELGYKKSMAAEILGVSNATISSRLRSLEARLANGYAKNRVVR